MQNDSGETTPSNPATNTSSNRQLATTYTLRVNQGLKDYQVFKVTANNVFEALIKFFKQTERDVSKHPDFATLGIEVSVHTETVDENKA
jgi:hypothetical protein